MIIQKQLTFQTSLKMSALVEELSAKTGLSVGHSDITLKIACKRSFAPCPSQSNVIRRFLLFLEAL